MYKILFPIFSVLIFSIVAAFAWTTYGYYKAIHSDDPIMPYLSVTTGSVTIGRGDIAIDMTGGERYNVEESDIIMTKANTFAILHWPDHSTTRLGDNSRATIKRMRVTDDYSAIEIELTLERGKIWNNAVRTIYPGSYFRMRLPDNNVIAGVRGTVFEINLDKSYIHSVDHSVALSDGLGRVATMLPGDVVDTKDILKKLGQTILDSAWTQINMTQDIADNLIHSAQVEQSFVMLSEVRGIWDHFVRWVLSFFTGFKDIQIVMSLSEIDTNVPKEYLLKWYQHFQGDTFITERDQIRSIIVKTWTSGDDYIDAVVRGGIWDKITFSGMTLAGTDALITNYTKTIDTKLQSVLKMVPVSELQNKAKETLRMLVK